MVAASYFDLNQGAWRSAIHRQQWKSSIDRFAVPAIGAMPVAEIGAGAIQQCLGPLWSEKPVAAQRLRGRIERVLDYAAALGLWPPSVANPAAMKCVRNLLPKTRRTKRHYAAVSVSDAPLLMATLAEVEGIAARALEFTILTCVRTNETLGALWSEFDLAGKTWTIPPERTRSRRVFRVPLAEPALRLIGELPRAENSPYVFAGESGRPLGRLAMLRVLRRLRPGATTHGFRSCFADWAAEHTSASYEAREGALCHSVGSDVERAYRRGDLLDLRRGLAEAWGSYLTAEPSDVVVPLRRGGGLQ